MRRVGGKALGGSRRLRRGSAPPGPAWTTRQGPRQGPRTADSDAKEGRPARGRDAEAAEERGRAPGVGGVALGPPGLRPRPRFGPGPSPAERGPSSAFFVRRVRGLAAEAAPGQFIK